MKSFLYFLILFVTLFSSCSTQSKSERNELLQKQFNQIKALLESGEYEFEAQWATPLDPDAIRILSQLPGADGIFQGNRVNLTGNSNFLKIKGTKSEIAMPYFGRAFTASSFGGRDSGIEYKGEILDYKINYNEKKQQANVTFSADKPNDDLQFQLLITASGNTTLSVNSSNRQNIQYDGNVSSIKED